jgi:hypothetical protein
MPKWNERTGREGINLNVAFKIVAATANQWFPLVQSTTSRHTHQPPEQDPGPERRDNQRKDEHPTSDMMPEGNGAAPVARPHPPPLIAFTSMDHCM